MFHIEFQMKPKKIGVTENISMPGTVSTSFQSGQPNNKDHIHSPFAAALQPFSFLAGQCAVYFYLRSFLSSSEKAKWIVVDSSFTTSILKIVLAGYSGVVAQGVKHGVTGRGPGTRAESCELWSNASLPWRSHSLFICVSLCVLPALAGIVLSACVVRVPVRTHATALW